MHTQKPSSKFGVLFQQPKLLGILLTTALTLSGCASTGNITPNYVSPNNYKEFNCQQLNQEMNRIDRYIKEYQNSKPTLSATGVGVGIAGNRHGIYPTISFGIGSSTSVDAHRNKLSDLYGERDAVVQAAKIKGCEFSQGLTLYKESNDSN